MFTRQSFGNVGSGAGRWRQMNRQGDLLPVIDEGAIDETVMGETAVGDGTVKAETPEPSGGQTKKSRWGIRKSEWNSISSPNGVEEIDSSSFMFKSPKMSKASATKSKISSRPSSSFSFDDDTNASGYDGETRTRDDDTRTYDDDTRTYDTVNYDDTTLGDTLEETTVGDTCFSDNDTFRSGFKKHTSSDKRGNRPERGKKYNRGDKCQLIDHSHRGRKGRENDDFADAMCTFPSMSYIREEVEGTYKDASSAFHQVLHAFVISPDNIDRMSDKIRDAKVKLARQYYAR
jgi:hypothetical protein